MPRTRDVTMDGLTIKIAALSYNKTMEHFKKGREMVAVDPKPSDEDWTGRTVELVVWSLNRAAGTQEWTAEKLRDDLDMIFIRKLHDEIMHLTTGVLPTAEEAPGEAVAASTGR